LGWPRPATTVERSDAGIIKGKLSYVSPEQVLGQPIDHRSDIFSLGASLYELTCNKRPFEASSDGEVVMKIREVDFIRPSEAVPDFNPALESIILRAMQKEPDERYQTAARMREELARFLQAVPTPPSDRELAARRKSREKLAWITAGLAGVTAAVFAVGFFLRTPVEPRQVRFEIAPMPELTQIGSPRLSPDGLHLAFHGIDGEGNSKIWLRDLASLEARPIAGTEGAGTGAENESRPIWSPDSRYIAFFVGTKLKKVPISGGPAQTICEAGGADGTWSTQGEIVFDGSATDPLWRVSAAGGVAKPEVSPTDLEGVTSVGWPEFLPDGRRFIYLSEPDSGSTTMRLHTLGEKEDVELAVADSRVQYAEPGYLIYVLDGMLVAHPFDAGTGELKGEPMPLADNIGASAVGLADFSASTDRTLAFRSGESGGRQLRWFDRDGRQVGELGAADEFSNFRLSPDGRRVVTEIADSATGNVDLWIHDLERGTASRFTFDPGNDYGPAWSPDGDSIIYTAAGEDGLSLIRKAASGTGATEVLLKSESNILAGQVSPDGRFLTYMTSGGETSWDILAMPLDGSGEAFPLLASEFVEVRPSFSPDGKWFAYNSNESGKMKVYVRQFPGPGGQWQISTDGGSEPVWSADGREIFYIDSGRNLVSVPVATGTTLEAGLPETLFDPPIYPVTQRERYVVTRDGGRFLMLSTTSGVSVRPTTVVLNWDVDLQQ